MAKTQKYIVIKPHTLGHEVGAAISLTEEKAFNLVGKVRLQSEGVIDKAKSDVTVKLKKENEDLKAEKKLLEELIETLESENVTLKEAAEKAVK